MVPSYATEISLFFHLVSRGAKTFALRGAEVFSTVVIGVLVVEIGAERAVTADTALRLARFFGTSPEFLMNLQAMHNLTKARMESGEAIARDVRPRAA